MDDAFNRWKECRHGVLLYNINDCYIGKSLELYGEFSHGEGTLFSQIIRPRDIVVEVGANIGAHTLQLVKLAGPEGGILAFEPQRLAFQALCANMAMNSIPNAWCYQMALGREPGTIPVRQIDPLCENNFGGLSLQCPILPGRPYEQVPMSTLDAFPLPRCRLLKVDVEGMELDVLLGGKETIRRHWPLLYVENNSSDQSSDLIRHIASLGYSMYWHKPHFFHPENFRNNPENVFGRVLSKNMLCIPAGGRIAVQGFKPIDVPP